MYQGRNARNVGIPEEIHNLPATQKAVVNAVIQSKIGYDPDGMRAMFMHNWYIAAHLLILLREIYQILGARMIRKNRIGWPKDQMTLSKLDERGASLTLYGKVNRLIVTQWNDNKVVGCTSTLGVGVSGFVPVSRRRGAENLNLFVEKALRRHQEGMDGVDRGDQSRECGAGFAAKAHYKKWYKKGDMAVQDFMLLNSFYAWNMAAADPSLNCMKLTSWEYYAVAAEEMIVYEDTEFTSGPSGIDWNGNDTTLNTKHLHKAMAKGGRRFCIVCKIEEKWRGEDGIKDAPGKSARSQFHMAMCTNESCKTVAHATKVDHERKILNMPCFVGMSCFNIMYSRECSGLWTISPIAGMGGVPSYGVNRKLPIYVHLREQYARGPETRKRSIRDAMEDSEDDIEESVESGGGTRGRKLETGVDMMRWKSVKSVKT